MRRQFVPGGIYHVFSRGSNRQPIFAFDSDRVDFLLCLVAFLLVTAVWSNMSRLPADAMHEGNPECCPPRTKPKTLHVTVDEGTDRVDQHGFFVVHMYGHIDT